MTIRSLLGLCEDISLPGSLRNNCGEELDEHSFTFHPRASILSRPPNPTHNHTNTHELCTTIKPHVTSIQLQLHTSSQACFHCACVVMHREQSVHPVVAHLEKERDQSSNSARIVYAGTPSMREVTVIRCFARIDSR